MAPLFKDGAGLMEQGLDLLRRGDFVKAGDRFVAAGMRFQKEGNGLGVSAATGYAGVMSLAGHLGDPSYLISVANTLRAHPGDFDLHLGPRTVSAAQLAIQLEAGAKDLNLAAAVQSNTGDRAALATALQSLANDYRGLGDTTLVLPELFQHHSVTAESRVLPLMAQSFEILGGSLQESDPLAAAENYRTAQQYWIQVGNESRAAACSERVSHLAFRAKCWFCGREGIGHGIQFVMMPIDEDVTGLRGTDSVILPSVEQSGRGIYACKGCNSAVRLQAARTAQVEVAAAEDRILREVAALERRLRSGAAGGGLYR